MKQSIILWIATIVVTFSAGYIQRVESPRYPINGTIDLITGVVSFSFAKTASSKYDYKVWVADNCQSLNGTLLWKKQTDAAWNTLPMKSSNNNGTLYAYIPKQPPLKKVEYRVKLTERDSTVYAPVEKAATLEFLGNVPSQISMFYFITLFAGLLLAIRTGFEVFKESPRLRLYTIFTTISFFCFTLIFSTVKKGCELGIIGKTQTAPISDIFSIGSVLLFAWWILAMILIFNTKKARLWASIASIGTLLIFFLGNF